MIIMIKSNTQSFLLFQIGKGKTAKKAKSGSIGVSVNHEYKKAPHTFVFNRGHVGKTVNDLLRDMRRVLEPYTASKLKVSHKDMC